MAKDKEKQLSEFYYLEKNKTAKEISILVGVTEATVSKWVTSGGWKVRREAMAFSSTSRCNNIEQVISELASQRIELSRELDRALAVKDDETVDLIRKKLASIDDGAGKWNKTLEVAKKDGKVSLATYLEVMEQIFNALRDYNDKLFLQTIDFQENHIREVSHRL